jgi:hypothetical protein
MTENNKNSFRTFEEFWPFYLSEHSNRLNRRLHFIGTLGVLLIVIAAVINLRWSYLIWAPLIGYSFAWIGHFIVEKNRPATFKFPLWSLRGDFRMFRWMLQGKF